MLFCKLDFASASKEGSAPRTRGYNNYPRVTLCVRESAEKPTRPIPIVSEMTDQHLSAYEIQRLENIERNKAVLREMGLEKPLIPKKAARAAKPPVKRARKDDDDPDFVPERRTTRVTGGSKAAKDEDVSSDDDSDDDEYESLPRPKKAPKKAVPKVAAVPSVAAAATGEDVKSNCVMVEAAKTGRSKCRGCMEMLAQGELRVGMDSWMVGRQVTVWQHPVCFWKGLAITAEPTGRGKCKATSAAFAKGELRVSAKAHITTNHFKLSCAHDAVLARVQATDPAACLLSSIEGIDELSEGHKAMLEKPSSSSSSSSGAPAAKLEVEETPTTEAAMSAKEEEIEKKATAKDEEKKQPPKGRVTKAKGKVCWTFAGHLCYGSLLPNQESATHCYARTHKGNTKTLTKGGTSWWMLES